jgi:hypothetical protein
MEGLEEEPQRQMYHASYDAGDASVGWLCEYPAKGVNEIKKSKTIEIFVLRNIHSQYFS